MNIQISDPIVAVNFVTLGEFEKGDLPLTDAKSGEITKDKRAFAFFSGNFDHEVIRMTFEKGLELIQSTTKSNIEREKVNRNFIAATEGVKTIAKTLREKNSQETAEALDRIATNFFDKFKNLPCPTKPNAAQGTVRMRTPHKETLEGQIQQFRLSPPVSSSEDRLSDISMESMGADRIIRVEKDKKKQDDIPDDFTFTVSEGGQTVEDVEEETSGCGCIDKLFK